MLGSRGVGKTSLLASVYDQFDSAVRNIDLALTPDTKTSGILQKCLSDLKSMADTFTPKGGIGGTSGVMEFVFDLGTIGKSPELRLIFTDFRGGLIEEDPEKIQGLLRESDVILLAIDAPAMMEKRDANSGKPEGRWHEKINLPTTITALFKKFTQNLNGTKLLLLVPVKCESYLQSEKDAKNLLSVLEQCYQSILSDLSKEKLPSQIAVAVNSVQTLGNVRYSSINILPSGGPQFSFRKFKSPAYEPKDVEEVLKYTLGFSIKKYLDNMPWWKRIFKLTRHFENAVKKLATDRTDDPKRGFKIIQGHHLLNFKD